MKFLLFDLSANGKAMNQEASVHNSKNWPRMLHLCWQMIDENGAILDEQYDLIKPEGFTPRLAMLERHQLDQEQLMEEGVNLKASLESFMKAVEKADLVFAHNLEPHAGVVRAEAVRTKIDDQLYLADRYCLMQETTYFCALPGRRGQYKWPSMTDLHKKIFSRTYAGAGNAEADVRALARCFIVLYKTEKLEDIFE